MPKHNIPVYAIVELLILLAQHDKGIGDYKGHTNHGNYVLVKTSGGSINLSQSVIMKQFATPEKVTDKELLNLVSLFKPNHLLRRSA